MPENRLLEIPMPRTPIFKAAIWAQLASKANRRVPTVRGGKYRSEKSPAAKQFMAVAVPTIKTRAMVWQKDKKCELPFTGLCVGIVKVVYKNWRSDSDPALIWDALEQAGVIENDRLVRHQYVVADTVDHAFPHVALELYEYADCSWRSGPPAKKIEEMSPAELLALYRKKGRR